VVAHVQILIICVTYGPILSPRQQPNNCVFDRASWFYAPAIMARNEIPSVKTIDGGAPVECLLDQFPQQYDIMYDTTTCILSQQGNACRNLSSASSISRLGSNRQSRVRAILWDTTKHNSDESWSPKLHLVPKKHNGWSPCGNYRTLNSRNIPDGCPVRHIAYYLYLSLRCACFQLKLCPP